MLKRITLFSLFVIGLYISNNPTHAGNRSTIATGIENPNSFFLALNTVDNTIEFNTLQEFYTSTGGSNWNDQTNWSSENIGDWFGVSVKNDDVVELVLNNNNLTGEIPASIGNLSELTKLFLSKNQLTGSVPQELASLSNCLHFKLNDNMLSALPDFSTHPNASNIKLQLDNNNLNFGDLETFFDNTNNLTIKFISYKGQAQIGEEQELTFNDGMPIELKVETPGEFNTYQWQKMALKNQDKGNNNSQSSKIEWIDINGATDPVYYTVDYIKEDVLGTYRCAVSNTKVPGLTLFSKEISVNIEEYTETRFYINTTDLKNGLDFQATKYQIIAPELDDTLSFGSNEGFIIVNPEPTTNIIINILNNNTSISIGYIFKVDMNGSIHDLKLANGMEQKNINQYFYEIKGSQLSLFPVIPLRKKWPDINLTLENGIYFSPNGDGFFDFLEVKGSDNITQFLLEIKDINNSLVFDSNDLRIVWDGNDKTSNQLVSRGVYKYSIFADDNEVSGQLIVKY